MKGLLIVVLLLSMIKVNSYSQNTSDLNEVWTIASIGMGDYFENKTYSTLHDTTINLNSYKAIYQSNDSIFIIANSEYFCAYRIIDEQWYFIPEGQTDEFLLYDFNVKVNDTVNINNPWVNGETELIVFEIDSILLHEIYHKKLAIGYYHKFSNSPVILEYWIEGIGCTNGLFYSGCTFVDIGFQLLCYHKNDLLLYLNSPNNSCGYITTGINQEIANTKINIYPNPAKNVLNIESNTKIERLDIFDISGRTIDSFEIKSMDNVIKIDINNYPNFFLIRIAGKDFLSYQKIIKE